MANEPFARPQNSPMIETSLSFMNNFTEPSGCSPTGQEGPSEVHVSV